MSEEDIIKICKLICGTKNKKGKRKYKTIERMNLLRDYNEDTLEEAIQGLLDLYYKEREKSKELEKRFNKEKEKNKEIEKKLKEIENLIHFGKPKKMKFLKHESCEWCGGKLYENYICSKCGRETECK